MALPQIKQSTGSPLANVLVGVRAILPQFLLDKLRDFGKAIDEGAIDDLAKGSAAVNAIQQTPVPSHALVGIGGSDLVGDALTLAPGGLGILFKILNFVDDNTDIFAGIQHDLIVGRPSQEGGLPSSAITVFDGLGSIHTAVTGNAGYSAKTIDLYNTAGDTSSFAEFPAPGSLLGALAAALPGFIDFLSISNPSARRIAFTHMLINLSLVAVYSINLWLRTTPSDSSLPILLSAMGVVLLGVSGWLGGELVFRHGIGSSRDRPGARAGEGFPSR